MSKNASIKPVALILLSEVGASFLYSLIFFVFVARFISGNYNISYDQLSLILAAGFMAATYIGSHKYAVDVLPFITLIKLLEEGFSLLRILHFPAQILGTAMAYLGFLSLNNAVFGIEPQNYNLPAFQQELFNPNLVLLFNGAGVALFYFVYSIIRYRFRLNRFIGLLFTTLLLATLIFTSIRIEGLTFTNPIGFLTLTLMSPEEFGFSPFTLLAQIGSPILFVVIVYIYSKVTRQSINTSRNKGQLSNFEL